MSNGVNKFQFRLVLLGSNGTGKTSILNRFLFKKFETKHKPTVEDLFSKDFDLGAIEIKEARPDDYQEVPIVFVGNKCDIAKEKRQVTKEQVSEYVYYELPRLRTKVIECSCKDNINVDSIFKAYLSLAKVREFTRVVGNSKSPLTTTTPPPPSKQQQQQQPPLDTSSNFDYTGAIRERVSTKTIANNNNNLTETSSHNYYYCHSERLYASPVPANNSNNGSSNVNNSTTTSRQQRSSSIKLSLGMRKSCDASIVSSMRKVSLSGFSSGKNSREQLSSIKQQMKDSQESLQQIMTEVVLKDVMTGGAVTCGETDAKSVFGRSGSHSSSGNKLAVEQGAKPRSRSLIWRPNRKSSKTSTNNDCKVT